MLVLSEEIFTRALGMDDSEAWLHHYMLGKIAEKLRKSPEIYLEHYEKSSRHLDEDIANYPRKIPFYSPPDHVLEALEVYYRVHVSVLKLLLNEFPDVNKEILEKYLQRAAKGPFFSHEYDIDGGHSIAFRSESTASETNAIEPDKGVFELSSEFLASTKIDTSTAPVSQSTVPTAMQVSFDVKQDVRAEKSGLAQAASKDNDDVVSDSQLQGQVQKDKDGLEEPREVTPAMEMTEEKSAAVTSKLLQEQPPHDEKLKKEPSKDVKENIPSSLITEPIESTLRKPQESVIEDDNGNVTKDKSVSNNPFADALTKESKNEEVGKSGSVSESIKQEEEIEEKMEVEEKEALLVASNVAKQPDDTNGLKGTETEVAQPVKSNVSQQISKDDTPGSKPDSHILEVVEGMSGIEDTETCKSKSLSSYDKPNTQKEVAVDVPARTPVLLKGTSEISKEHAYAQDFEMANPTCTPENSKELSMQDVKDFDRVKQIGQEDISKDLLKVKSSKEEMESVDSSKFYPGETEMHEMGVPMDTKKITDEQDEEMENTKVTKRPELSTNISDTVEKLSPAIPMDISQSQPEKEGLKKIHPKDTTLMSNETIHESGVGKEALEDTREISASAEEDKVGESKDILRSQSKDKESVTAPKESREETPLVSNGSNSKRFENDSQIRNVGKESKTDKEESLVTNQCIPAQSIVKDKKPLTDEQKIVQRELIDVCIHGLEHCLLRFPQHHKCRYRLANVYYVSPYHKDLQLSRALLLGGNTGKAKLQRNPHQGLFNEKSKTNMFSAFWRIPEEDIDRPGSFCTHTHKSVDLLLQVLRDVNEWDTLISISNLLHRTPEPGKKYLRDNERHFLSKKACDFSVEIMAKRVESQDAQVEPAVLSQLLFDAYECWKIAQKYEGTAKISENLVVKAFEMYREKVPDITDLQSGGESQPSVLDRAIRFCQQSSKPQTSSTSTTAHQTPADSSVDSQIDNAFGSDDIVMSEPRDVSKTAASKDQPDTTSLQKEAKESNGISGKATKEKEIESEAVAIKNTLSKTNERSVSLTEAPTEPLERFTCSTINTLGSKNVSKETSKETKDVCTTRFNQETSSKDTGSGILTKHLDPNQQQSGIGSTIYTKPSVDIPETFPKAEASPLEIQKAFESDSLISAVAECSQSKVSLTLTAKSLDSALDENAKQESPLSLDKDPSFTEPVSLDDQQ
ncbi:uncharacterized protein LOC116294232 [Actinia tenebrosa]|uniref:Uncharacterized protein LOC116294232 n=1 Tax=Actinia tenebrosa TaxID=6105 RepID=A0A6P8HYE9_ACTTE|nr:uncharacterized protein LOC116294232 [Actinia tenebrosa]